LERSSWKLQEQHWSLSNLPSLSLLLSISTSIMHIRLLSSALLFVASALYPHGAQAAREPSCDDHSDLSPACGFIDPDLSLASCHDAQVLAIQRGCFVCVDPLSCSSPTQQESHDAAGAALLKAKATATEARMMPSNVELSPAHEEHAGEQAIPIHAEQAAVGVAVVPPSQPQRQRAMQEVSNWYFLIPALLALVSVGIAVRKRIGHGDIEFERVEGEDLEEINPFCADATCCPQQGEEDLEYGKPAAGDDSEDEASHCQH
jgi:hypothetical protein